MATGEKTSSKRLAPPAPPKVQCWLGERIFQLTLASQQKGSRLAAKHNIDLGGAGIGGEVCRKSGRLWVTTIGVNLVKEAPSFASEASG